MSVYELLLLLHIISAIIWVYVVGGSMVAKPTGDDGGLLGALALALAAVVAGAFMWRGRNVSVGA